ncbi:MAG: truB [Paenibacillaceae bacterium]|jgi:tRNA pseudouridine55 synthase|nr:truB [Paenibacillaceae bacterium]
MNAEGILPIWKPVDYTSHDVVAKARRILGIKRIGHTGTLDPAVTGVLPLCIGKATRLVEYIQELPKEYEARLVIGMATDTEDMTGQITERSESVYLDPETVRRAVASFVGIIQQIPPMYSAVKVDGKRLYELARSGETVERKSRQVTIYQIEILSMNLELTQPEIVFRALCSKGTYIRTLCADIGKALGYPAVMGGLVRTATGGMTRERCVTLEELADAKSRGEEALSTLLVPSDEAVSFFPAVAVNAAMALAATQGKTLRIEDPALASFQTEVSLPEDMRALRRIYGPEGRFLGLFRLQEDGVALVPEKVFVPEAN